MAVKRSPCVGEPSVGHTAATKNLLAPDISVAETPNVPVKYAVVWSVRVFYLGLLAGALLYYDLLQMRVNQLWSYLLTSSFFSSVYFETCWTTICYGLCIPIPWAMTKFRYFDKYKIDPQLTWQSLGGMFYLIDAVKYGSPLYLLDTFIVKKYHGVDPGEWASRRQSWIQYTRALPHDPPTVASIAGCIVGAFLIYDFVFFLFHFTLHKNRWLYQNVHALHHTHEVVHAQVTNQLSVTERIALVLFANESLKLLRSHPLTRALFVPFFVGWLVENHSCFNVPWTLDKVIPFSLVSGSPGHYAHHAHGSRNYQPFFTYIDHFLQLRKTKKHDK